MGTPLDAEAPSARRQSLASAIARSISSSESFLSARRHSLASAIARSISSSESSSTRACPTLVCGAGGHRFFAIGRSECAKADRSNEGWYWLSELSSRSWLAPRMRGSGESHSARGTAVLPPCRPESPTGPREAFGTTALKDRLGLRSATSDASRCSPSAE